MKVQFATYPMAFHTPGGGEVQLLAYERHLPAHGVEVTRFDPWNPRFAEHQLVHFFSTVGGSSHFCGFVKSLGLPLVVTSSLWVTEATAHLFPIDEIRHQVHLADRVVTNSETESDTLARLLGLPRGKFRAVPNAVDDHFLEPADSSLFSRAFGIDGDFVLSVANIEPRKNQLLLVEAMRARPGLPLVLVGNIRDPAYYRQVIEAGGAQLRFLGTLPHDGPLLASAYAACRLFALPSLFETPGLAALEAAAQGAPLLVTQEGSTKEYFGERATYADPASAASIATGLAEALSRPPPESFRPASWTEATATLAAVYAEVVAG